MKTCYFLCALELYKLKSTKGVGFAYIHYWKIHKDVSHWDEIWEEVRRQLAVKSWRRGIFKFLSIQADPRLLNMSKNARR